MLAALLAGLLPLVAGVSSEIPPPPEVPNDTAEFRRFVLENGMKVLLLSDPKLNKSSAALTVGVGSLSDPPERQGLAHFLEHMLFLGTEKYPDVADFDAYLKANGGYNNAGTWPDHTTYMLEIRHEAFPGALDRFSQFFIAPLFDPTFTEREMNAVNSEFHRHLEHDGRRAAQVAATRYREGHPMAHFAIGNRETLTGTTREELLAFYEQYYSADQMALALTGRASLDELEAWAREYFGPVPNRGRKPVRFSPDYLPEKPALRLLRVAAVKDERQISLEFPLPSTVRHWQSKPDVLLGFILGYEGEGSLLSHLKNEGLATALAAGSYDYAQSFASFRIEIDLTPAGLENYPRVLELVFAAIAELKRADYPGYLFHERQTMARLEEAYRDKGEGASRAVDLSTLLWTYPLEVAERVPFLWVREDADAYRELLAQLRPDNLLVTLLARGLPTDQVEPYYGTEYSYSEETGPAYTALLDPPKVAGIHLPAPNPFIPTEVGQLALRPVQLIAEPVLSLYYWQDTEFQRPLVAELYRFRFPRSLATREGAARLMFYEACVREALNEIAYTAGEAGLHLEITADLDGVQINLDGYDATAPRLREAVVESLVDFELPEARFAAIKDRLVRSLEDFALQEAFQIAQQTRRTVAREFYYRPDELLPVARELTLDAVRRFARQLYQRGRIEALVHGNVTAEEAVAAARQFAGTLKTRAAGAGDLIARRMLVQPPGDTILLVEQVQGSNSAFRREYILGEDTPEIRAATVLLSNAIQDPVYSELRTRQQLGYIVGGAAFSEFRVHGMLVLVQSAEYAPQELQQRAEALIATLPDKVRGMSDEEWDMLVAGAQAELEAEDKSIAERAERLFSLAYDFDADWDRREETLAALDQLTRERAADILAAAIAPETRRMRTFLVYGRNEPVPPELQPTFTDRAAWKRKQTYR